MATVLHTQTVFQNFRDNLYSENLRGAWELESMVYGIMARLGLDEPDALELAVKIVTGPPYILFASRGGGETEKV